MDEQKPGLRGKELGQLYARAKTYEERQKDKQRLDELRLARRPQKPRVKIAASGSLIFMLGALLIGNIGQLWLSGNIAIISFTFLAGLVLASLVISWIKYVFEVFYSYENQGMYFWIISDLLMLALFMAMFYGWFGLDTGLVSGLISGSVYFIVSYLSLKAVLKIQ